MMMSECSRQVLHDWFNKYRGMCYPVDGIYKRTLAANR